MPLKLTVGQSRKISENYNSTGFSLNIEAELPASAAQEPNTLAQAANDLFQLCEDILDERIRGSAGNANYRKPRSASEVAPQSDRRHDPSTRPESSTRRPTANGGNGNGNGHSNGGPKPITKAQTKAILNMCRRLERDADVVAEGNFGVGGVHELSIRQASELIDALKADIESTTTAGVGR